MLERSHLVVGHDTDSGDRCPFSLVPVVHILDLNFPGDESEDHGLGDRRRGHRLDLDLGVDRETAEGIEQVTEIGGVDRVGPFHLDRPAGNQNF